MIKLLKSATVAVSLGIALSSTALAAETPKQGGTLVYLDRAPHTGLFPTGVGQYPNGAVLNQLVDRLTYQNPETFEIEPWIATSWEINSGYTEFTFKLREGVTYSDGTPLTAGNVIRNFDIFGRGDKDLKLPASEVVNNYVSGEAIDDHTVRFTFSAPAPGFLQATSVIASGLQSDAALKQPLDKFGKAENVIGSGPFVVSQSLTDNQLTFTARADYNWAPVKSIHQGRAYLDSVKIVVIPEDSVRIGALLAKQADILRHVQAYDEQAIRDAGYKLYSPSAHGLNNSIVFRPDNPLVADVRVRQALLHGTNVPEILSTLFTDTYRPARSILTSSVAGFVDLSDELRFDPELSNKLLDEAGWVKGKDGIRQKDGQELALRIYEDAAQPQNRAHLQLVSQQWLKLGVKLEVLAGDAGSRAADTLIPERTPLRPAMIGRADPDALKSQYYPSNRNVFLQADGVNKAVKSFKDEELNKLLEDVASEADPKQRLAKVGDVQRLVIEKAYAIPFFEEPQVFAAAPDVHGFGVEAVARPSFYSVWLDR